MPEKKFPKNIFRLEGKVEEMKSLQSGVNESTGKVWHKLEILLSMESEKHHSTYYYPIILWNGTAKKAVEEKGLCCGDYISVDGQLVSKEYQSNRDGTTNYFVNPTGYGVAIIEKATTTAPVIQEEDDDDVPF